MELYAVLGARRERRSSSSTTAPTGTRDAAGGEWKFVKYFGPDAGEAELYDLAADPYEVHNRAEDLELASLRADLESRVDDWWQRTRGRDFAYYESPEFKLSGAANLIDGSGNDANTTDSG